MKGDGDTITKAEWGASLRGYLAEQRAIWPVPARELLSWDQEFQCQIQGGSLSGWLAKWRPRLIRERNLLPSKSAGADSNPLVVILTDVSGIVAADAIVPASSPDLVFCLKAEFAAFHEAYPDPEFLVHCRYQTTFDTLGESEAYKLRASRGLADDALIAVHSEVSTLGPLFARGARHLWDFTGDTPRLVEEAFETWVS